MTLDEAHRLRIGDILNNQAISGSLTVVGPVYYHQGDIAAIPCNNPNGGYVTPSFVSLSTLAKRMVPSHMTLPVGA